MKRLSRFMRSSFRMCNTPCEFGERAAKLDNQIDAYLKDDEIVSEYSEFFEGDGVVSFDEEEWKEFVTAYVKSRPA